MREIESRYQQMRRMSSSLSLILITLFVPTYVQGFGTIDVWTDRSVYDIGDPILVSFDTGGGNIEGTVTIDIVGPVSLTYGPTSVVTGRIYTITISSATLAPGYYDVRVALGLEFDIYEGYTFFQIQSAPFDFTLMISPQTLNIKKGENAAYIWNITYSDPSYRGTRFSWDVSGLGLGMEANAEAGKLYVQTSESTPSGNYNLTFSLTAKGVRHSIPFSLIVEPEFDFTLSISPSESSIYIGENTTFKIDVNLISGASKSVTLSLSGLPTDISYRFSTTSDNPSFISTLTVETSSLTKEGNYTFTIEGVSEETADSKTVILHITQKPIEISITTLVEGKKVILTGTLTPKEPSEISLQYQMISEDDSQRIVRNVQSNANGIFTDEFAPDTAGEWIVKAIVKNNSNETISSNIEYFEIEKNLLDKLIDFIRINSFILLIIIIILATVFLAFRKSSKKPADHCQNCGEPLQPDDLFCGSCGRKPNQK